MSQKIHILSRQLANQIAAGEVVERPLSVVKELVENSLDAGASSIEVFLEEGGIRNIKVRDNGEGISPEDIKIVLEKYATSKIHDIQDLSHIATFGFRGEALASIASVSEFTLISKTQDAIGASKICTQGGEEIEFSEVSQDVGTTIQVGNLFFNTPARMNYLKKARTEYMKIHDFLGKLSFAYPQVQFRLFHDGRQIFSFAKTDDPRSRIYELFGNDVYENLIEVSYDFDGMSCRGYITHPKISFSNKNRQVIFVNGRLVSSPIIAKALFDGYNRFIPHASQPSYVLFLSLDPTQVDVNVHPRKMELRFAHEASVFRSVYHGVKNALEKISLVSDTSPHNSVENISHSKTHSQSLSTQDRELNPQYYTGSGTKFKNYSPYKNTQSNPAQHAIDFSATLFSQNVSTRTGVDENMLGERETPLGNIIGQLHNSYIIVESSFGIQILDQHAVAERVIYERLAKTDYQPHKQGILGGISLHLALNEREILEEHKAVFETMGFEIESLTHGNITIYAIPDFLRKNNIEKVFKDILSDVSDLGSRSLQEVQHKIWAYTACRSAIKFGDPLSMREMQQLLFDASFDYSATCPHGRPVVWEMTLEQLQKKYER